MADKSHGNAFSTGEHPSEGTTLNKIRPKSAKTKEKDSALAGHLEGEGSLTLHIKPPNMQTLSIDIVGTAPLMINKFSHKAVEAMAATQQAGSQSKKGKKREPKDFDAAFENARHVSREGWDGIAASAFRNAMISACRLVNFKMTIAKLSVFIVADGYDRDDGTPLVRILGDAPLKSQMPARNATGVMDIRIRPQWPEWRATLRVRYDADQFSANDVVNLIMRVGMQCGIGEGRPDSKMSAGIGFGTFMVAQEDERTAAE